LPIPHWIRPRWRRWTLSTTAPADGGIEDDGSGDFAIYTTALLPGVNNQLKLLAIRDNIDAYEGAPA
jgi:hypothetical protein